MWEAATVPEPLVSVTMPASDMVSPQSTTAVCVSLVPASVKEAGSRGTRSPSVTVWSSPALTTGSALVTVINAVSLPRAPSSSATVSVIVSPGVSSMPVRCGCALDASSRAH